MTFPRDSHITDPGDVRRLSAQNQSVLARLQRGPATRKELQAIASNITARISDLRKAGYVIPKPSGRSSVYWLADRTISRASVPSDVGERQDLRADIEKAPHDVHDLNSWGLR